MDFSTLLPNDCLVNTLLFGYHAFVNLEGALSNCFCTQHISTPPPPRPGVLGQSICDMFIKVLPEKNMALSGRSVAFNFINLNCAVQHLWLIRSFIASQCQCCTPGNALSKKGTCLFIIFFVNILDFKIFVELIVHRSGRINCTPGIAFLQKLSLVVF